MRSLIIGTRSSRLALWQAHYVRDLLVQKDKDLQIEIRPIRTRGDKEQQVALSEIGGKGLFTKELEDALITDEIQLAVHSLKDLPTTLPDGLVYAGSPKRGDPRDAFVSLRWNRLADVPEDGTIATGSVRRRVLVQNQKPRVNFVDLRGNIETRLKKLEKEAWDGIIMASAALERIGKQELITEYLDPKVFVPAVGQGAIGIEVGETRVDVLALVSSISDVLTVQSVSAERAFMQRLEGGCSIPLGAWAHVKNGSMILTGFVSSLDGTKQIRQSQSGVPGDSESLGYELATIFIKLGTREIIHQ